MHSVLAWSEVPWLLLWVIITALQTLQLIVEVQNVVSLFVAQCVVLVLGKHINHILLFSSFNCCLSVIVLVHLSDWVVKCLLFLDELVRHFFILRLIALKIALVVHVFVHIALPLIDALGQIMLLRKLANICN